MPWLDDLVRVKKPVRLPSLLIQEETLTVLARVDEAEMKLIVGLRYCSGLRLLESLRQRVKALEGGYDIRLKQEMPGHSDIA